MALTGESMILNCESTNAILT